MNTNNNNNNTNNIKHKFRSKLAFAHYCVKTTILDYINSNPTYRDLWDESDEDKIAIFTTCIDLFQDNDTKPTKTEYHLINAYFNLKKIVD